MRISKWIITSYILTFIKCWVVTHVFVYYSCIVQDAKPFRARYHRSAQGGGRAGVTMILELFAAAYLALFIVGSAWAEW